MKILKYHRATNANLWNGYHMTPLMISSVFTLYEISEISIILPGALISSGNFPQLKFSSKIKNYDVDFTFHIRVLYLTK